MKFNSEINLGTVATSGAVLCSLVAWIVTGNNRSEQSSRDLATVQSAVSTQIADLRGVVTSGLIEVHQQIATLPDQRAKLEQVDRRLVDIEGRLNNTDQHVGLLERSTIEARAELNIILRNANGTIITGRATSP